MTDTVRHPVPVIAGYGEFGVIGQGGFATVYRARQKALGNRVVAVKVADRLADDAAQRFERECHAIGTLSGHPHVVAVFAAGFTDDTHQPYLVMEHLPDGSLAERVRSEGPLPWPEVARIGAQLASALAAAHREQILHRDLKPENVLVKGDVVKLADFGIAAVRTGSLSAPTAAHAVSIPYTAPELFAGGRASAASDLYGLGATLCALLTGRRPFVEDDDDTELAAIPRISTGRLRPLGGDVPAAFADLIGRLMSVDPATRPSDALVVLDELEKLAVGERPTPEARGPRPDGTSSDATSGDRSPERGGGTRFSTARQVPPAAPGGMRRPRSQPDGLPQARPPGAPIDEARPSPAVESPAVESPAVESPTVLRAARPTANAAPSPPGLRAGPRPIAGAGAAGESDRWANPVYRSPIEPLSRWSRHTPNRGGARRGPPVLDEPFAPPATPPRRSRRARPAAIAALAVLVLVLLAVMLAVFLLFN